MTRNPLRILLLALSALLGATPLAGQAGRMNVLFIAVDDLRPDLGAYGNREVHTPNLDRLAAEGLVFLRHYVQVPTCGASRFSLLTGQRPTTAAALGNEAFVELLPRTEGERPESFAHLFRRAGYHTASIGKISHYPDGRVFTYGGEGDGRLEMPFSWDHVQGPIGRWGTAWNAFFGYADGSNRNQERADKPAFEAVDLPDDGYPDGLITEAAIAKLREPRDRPFLLAVGFFKPHLPFTAPKKYWDLYDRDSLALSPGPVAPEGGNPRGLHASAELFNSYGPHPSRGGAGVRIDDEYARTLRHAYYAAVSYADAQVGRVLAELDRLGLRDSTIVVVWGDHGWHLGDQTIWGKHTTYERALRSPLIVRVPGMRAPGRATEAIVESLDIYPTLTELCGLPTPESLAGISFAAALRDPDWAGKGTAFGYYRGRRTLRTDRWRLVAYDAGEPRVELYDHHADPYETANVAARHPEVVARLLPALTVH